MDISIGIAFLFGLASFFSPCVFPLVPAYMGYLSGRSIHITESDPQIETKWMTIIHGLAFILGFSVVFILLGLSFSFLGGLLFSIKGFLAKLGGVVVILFGLHMTGLFRIKFLEYDFRIQNRVQKSVSIFSSFLMGIFFSAGWSPCIGPVLGSILALAVNTGDAGKGALLLGSYSIGFGIPFLLAAIGISWVTNILVKYRKAIRITEIAMGVILIIVGLMLITDLFSIIAQYGSFFGVS